jgi:hypothetical protein
MSKLAALRALAPLDLLRLTEAAAATLAMEIGLGLLPPRWCFALVRARGRLARRRGDAARLAALARIADRHLPGRAGCLRRALVLAWLLGRRGFRTRIWIGVARDQETLLAHAWIETDHGVFFRAADLPAAAWHPITSFPLCAGQSPG